MSRTDKDMPGWVQAEWFTPWHQCGWVRRWKWREVEITTSGGFTYVDMERHGWRWHYLDDCDLPKTPIRVNDRYGRNRGKTRCVWDAESLPQRHFQARYSKTKKVTRKFEFTAKQRTGERAAARKALKGDWEAEFPDGRTRHSVLWDLY